MKQQQSELKLIGTLKEVNAESNCFIIYYENRLLKFYADKELCVFISHMINEKIEVQYEYRTESNTSQLPPARTFLFAVEATKSK